MARYEYKCDNEKCEDHNISTIVVKPMMESDRVEYCYKCQTPLSRVYSTGAISTGDGFKSSK